MEENQKVSTMISLVLMGVAAVLIICCLFTNPDVPHFTTFVLVSVADIIALVCGVVYTIKGSTKAAAKWLKLFEVFTGVALLASVARISSVGNETAAIVLTTLAFGLLCILCCAEDLGKTRSYWIGAILIIARVVAMIIVFFSTIMNAMIVNYIAQLIMLVVLVMLLTQKYRDKGVRGAK